MCDKMIHIYVYNENDNIIEKRTECEAAIKEMEIDRYDVIRYLDEYKNEKGSYMIMISLRDDMDYFKSQIMQIYEFRSTILEYKTRENMKSYERFISKHMYK